MFKRVEKRRRKKEEELELGLDDDMKEVLGIHDTDSEESDSDLDQSLTSDVEFNESDREGSDGGDFGRGDEEDIDEGASENEEPVITVKEALRDPVYLISLQPDVKACIVCPGKLLKGEKMAHARRFKQLRVLLETASPTANVWDIVHQNAKPKTVSLAPIPESKRAEKRKAKALARKEQRQKQKAKSKARKAGLEQGSTFSSIPSNKRQKTKETSPCQTDVLPVHPTETSKDLSTEPTIKSIVRSTSDRAKQARTRASLKGPKNLVTVKAKPMNEHGKKL